MNKTGSFTGKKIDRYEFQELIGTGSFGEVYKAEHAFLKTPVAIKLLKKQFNGTDMLQRFEKEVKVRITQEDPKMDVVESQSRLLVLSSVSKEDLLIEL